MSSTSPSLDSMPDEILTNIVQSFLVESPIFPSEFDSDSKRVNSWFHHLSACSKRFHEITTPFLFHTISQTKERCLPALAKRLLAAPQNGRFIKRIFANANVNRVLDMADFSEEDFSRCEDIFRNATGNTRTTTITETAPLFTDALKRGEWDALLALLLCQTPYLESIELLGQGHPDSRLVFTEQVLEKAAELQAQAKNDSTTTGGCSLSHLHSASTYYWDTERGMGLWSIEPFVRLKSMEKIHVNLLVIESYHQYDVTRMENNVKELNINYGAIDGDRLIEFLPYFKSLEVIKYVDGGGSLGHAEFYPQKWGEAIVHLTGTLRMLDLAVSGGIALGNNGELVEALGPLVEFECLKELSIDCDVLLGPAEQHRFIDLDATGSESDDDEPETWRLLEVFPSSLEKLSVYDCDDRFPEQMIEVLLRKEELVPMLEILTVRGNIMHQDIGLSFVEPCKAAGVELKILQFGMGTEPAVSPSSPAPGPPVIIFGIPMGGNV